LRRYVPALEVEASAGAASDYRDGNQHLFEVPVEMNETHIFLPFERSLAPTPAALQKINSASLEPAKAVCVQTPKPA
jgi:hypothetical protein